MTVASSQSCTNALKQRWADCQSPSASILEPGATCLMVLVFLAISMYGNYDLDFFSEVKMSKCEVHLPTLSLE